MNLLEPESSHLSPKIRLSQHESSFVVVLMVSLYFDSNSNPRLFTRVLTIQGLIVSYTKKLVNAHTGGVNNNKKSMALDDVLWQIG